MPSKSVSLTDEHYLHILETKGEDQTFSDRVAEVLDKGIEAEDEVESFTCRHCGTAFGNQGAKATHEASCPEAEE